MAERAAGLPEPGSAAAVCKLFPIRGKIDGIKREVEHPLAQRVAQAICLLQYAQSIHRTPENIAATL